MSPARIAALEAHAANATPLIPRKRHSGLYDHLYPAFAILLKNGFGKIGAVRWLIEERGLPAEKESSAYVSLMTIHNKLTKPKV